MSVGFLRCVEQFNQRHNSNNPKQMNLQQHRWNNLACRIFNQQDINVWTGYILVQCRGKWRALVNTVMNKWALDRAFIGVSPSPDAEPALGRLDRCDDGSPSSWGIRVLLIFKKARIVIPHKALGLTYKFWEENGRVCWTKREKNVIRFGLRDFRFPPVSRWELKNLDSWLSNTGPIGCPETSVRDYHYSLRNNPEERSPQLVLVWFTILKLHTRTQYLTCCWIKI
jgi:hypothetical protein